MSDDFLEDPLWYKDAVIYELHVRSFYDADDDGYGDFRGLREKLPYLDDLGVNTLWLLPFLESPLRDDGYDIADYFSVLPVHGTVEDFRAFLEEAHDRGMRVITELVLNHTSDQHPWFQEARDPTSEKHDWYVWSETTDRYEDARIIFTDTEHSNWSWDAKAQKYYWHRFFGHQPDLNYENPEVHEAMKEVCFYWLDMGVDGLRLDAVPYLYEREGTDCENLPETLDFIKKLRGQVEERYGPGKVLLAEANQWPEDTLPYFGDGDGVQMAFNFPIMPRMYMALRREHRRPLVEMIEVTSGIPEESQWALFLRNHDELTLEMLTDEERDYMYHEYATDSTFRINVGIRRRLAPLLGGERRRIELMNALLMSLEGSPVIYYGDEIGMGDDPFLGDRNGVRTPMQWSPDKNGGFSRAPHHKLFLPPINEGPYSYDFLNVEDAQRDPHSLLNFTKRLLAMRGQYQKVFGRGTFELLEVENRQILAFVREYDERRVLVVTNLSRYAQSFHLPSDHDYEGMVPVELFSQSSFPVIGENSYHLNLGPHGFYWFALEPEEDVRARSRTQLRRTTAEPGHELPVLSVSEGLQNLVVRTMVHGRSMERLEEELSDYLRGQRWFGATEQTIRNVRIEDAVRIQSEPRQVYVSLLEITFESSTELYVLPLTLSRGETAETILEERSASAIAWVEAPRGRSLLHDATVQPAFWTALFSWWRTGGRGRSIQGVYIRRLETSVDSVDPENVELLTGEQSNSAAILDDRFFVKLYRRIEAGVNPEGEMLDYLTRQEFPFVPHLHGTVRFRRRRQTYTLGLLQEALPVDSDGWDHATELVRRFHGRVQDTRPPEEQEAPDRREAPVYLQEVASEVLSFVRLLGTRTAELHLALSRAEEEDLRPRPGGAEHTDRLLDRIRSDGERTFDRLRGREDLADTRPPENAWTRALSELERLREIEETPLLLRVHGDYHLGQIILADGELFVMDFEGEPTRSLAHRRERDSPLRDLAGILRSVDYAAGAVLSEAESADERLEVWTDRLVRWSERVLREAYFGTAEEGSFLRSRPVSDLFLRAYLLEKALYEVRYELDHRPDWIDLPLRGLRSLLTRPAPAAEPTETVS